MSTTGDKLHPQSHKNRSWTIGTPVVNVMVVAKQTLHRIKVKSKKA
ncbi:MAG TPA: hypothetical protein VFY67_17870 [Pyrinomonadaceae bacterium]|nr:hypothetical protein [Pyrinomonadaceae bacterium]